MSKRPNCILAVAFGLISAVGSLALVGCNSRDTTAVAVADHSQALLRRSLGGEPGTLDPHQADDNFAFEVLRDLYEGLTVSTPSGEVGPGAAASWSVDPTGTRYEFRLRPGLRWSNGDALTAAHFVAGLRRAVDPATASPGADLLRVIVNAADITAGRRPVTDLGVQAVDDGTLRIIVVRPAPYLPDLLANSVAMPLHPSGPPRGRSPETITNGAFLIAEARPGADLVLRPNPRYWDAAGVRLAEVRYVPLPDENVEFNRFRAGELDVTNNVPATRFEELAADPASGLQSRPSLATFFYAFNDTHGPLQGQPGLRAALSLAIDRETITRLITRAGQAPAYTFVPPGVAGYTSPEVPWRALQPAQRAARARQLYAAAGYSAGRPLRLRLVYNENDLIRSVTLAVAAMWKETLGVETDLQQLEYRAYLAARDDRTQWDVIRLGWSADYNDAAAFLDTLASDAQQNNGHWASAEYDRLLAAAHAEPDPDRRRGLLQQAEAVALADHAIAPVYFYVTRRLVRAGVSAPPLNPMNRNYSKYFRVAVPR